MQNLDSAQGSASKAVSPTKLTPPRHQTLDIERKLIADTIAAATHAKLVWVSSAAGFGKTTVLRQTMERMRSVGGAVSWLTLDRNDNNLARFEQCLWAVAEQLKPHQASDENRRSAVHTLANTAGRFAIFIDNLEVIREPASLSLLHTLAKAMPRHGQLLIGSRAMPPPDLAQLAASGDLLKIEEPMLRFSVDETRSFLALRDVPGLSSAALSQLYSKTEGWPVVLALAASSLLRAGPNSEFIKHFSGTDRAFGEYLAKNIVAHHTPEVREFLLRTSILRYLNASVCEALAPRLNSAAILTELECTHGLLSPVAGKEGWYKYHNLFANHLRAQLERERASDLPRMHLAASAWFQAKGQMVPAIDHAIMGGDFPCAVEMLLEEAEPMLEQGRVQMLWQWLSAIPQALLQANPLLEVVSLWAQALTRGVAPALLRLQTAACDHSADPAVQAHLNALPVVLLERMDRNDEAYAAGRLALARLPTARPFADSTLIATMMHLLIKRGHDAQARDMLENASLTQTSGRFNRVVAHTAEGVLHLRRGELRQAVARFQAAIEANPKADLDLKPRGNVWAGVLYACVAYETNDLDLAETLLNNYQPLVTQMGRADHIVLCYGIRARTALVRGKIDDCFQLLTELESLGHERQLTMVVASARLERANLLPSRRNADAAKAELDRADDPQVWDRAANEHSPANETSDIIIGRIRWDVLFGDACAAKSKLQFAIDEAQAAGRLPRSYKLRLMHASALARSGDMADALCELDTVLQILYREGFFRIVADDGQLLGSLLRQLQQNRLKLSGETRDKAFDEYLEQLLAGMGPEGAEAKSDTLFPSGSVAALSAKEARILQMLADGLSNAAMAEQLFVSDSTVRTHLRKINVKLGARNRTHAVAIARKERLVV